ncbi:hypothetical protein P3X46_011596 [Hevea brasiliensis]|uniref:Uncharacterized protein n=1 Tax=Hevea brasiliensis TaxID=3981 RepID=A0ABQ9M7T5_HEVBR|nr:trans-Golgi network-localized SYP41-interacting protein 1 [Hevea brasiliensis]KAJ9176261.1 hypothetical protein P3X46_011596 [Hevea brasiliensis]
MSDSNDSEVSLQNGDHAAPGVEEKEDSNGPINPETSINQEPEPEAVSEQIHHVESKEDMFVDATDDMQDNQFQEMDNGDTQDDSALAEKYTISEEYKEEIEGFKKEVATLRRQLRDLTRKKSLPGHDNEVQEEIVGSASLSEMMSECSQLVKVSLEERLQTETTIRELQLQIEALNGKVQVEQNVELIADRMLGSLSMVINQEELLDYSVMGKIAHVERNTSLLVEQYRWFLYEVDQLRQCLLEGGFNVGVQEEFGYGSVFGVARGELLELKKKEEEMPEKISHLEDMNKKLIDEVEKEKAMVETANSELEKLNVELDQEKNRCANTKEKLSMAVTKGKALVQQRDSLKQSLAEKTNELENCLVELQEKSSVAEAADLCKEELARSENLVASLQETLSKRNAILESCEEVFSEANVPKELQSMDITERLKWLVNLVASLQQTLSEKNAIFENFEAIFSQASVFEEIGSMDMTERLKWLVNLVASLQETLSEKNATFENFEAIFSQASVFEEIESMDMMERLKWLVNLVASLQEMLSQRNRILDSLEEIFSQISAPVEVQSMETVERFKWIVEDRNALNDNLLEFLKLKDTLSSIDLPETVSSSDLETRIGWLKESVNQAKGEVNMLQDEIARTKEAANNEIDRLSATLLVESQEKEYIKMELDDLACKFEGVAKEAHQASSEKDQMVKLLFEGSGITESYSDVAELIERCFGKIKEQSGASFGTSADAEVFERMQNLLYVRDQELTLCEKLLEEDVLVRSEVSNLSNELRVASAELAALKEERDSLQKDLQRSEEKSALLREKLSLAVKKGKGLVQDRENLKFSLDEKNTEIEKLKIELQQQESTVSEYRDQINRLSTDLEQIPKLEADLVAIKNQRDQLEQFLLESNNVLQRVIESVDRIVLPVDSVFEEPVEKVNWLAGYMNECQKSKSQAEQELDTVKEETSILASKLADAQQTMKSLEDALSGSENRVAQLTEEKREIEAAKESVEQDLQKSKDEAYAQTSKFIEACATKKSLEDALSLAENNISLIIKEREEAQLSISATETELERVSEEVAVQTGKLTEAYRTIKSLEDALSVAEANVSLLTEQNNHFQVGRTNLEYELKELKEEVRSQASGLANASTTMRSLEDALSKAANDISVLEGEKRIAEQEISTLNSKLKACMDELAGTNGSMENRSAELIHHLSDLQMHVKNESLLTMVRQHFEKEFENLRNIDHILRDIKSHLDNTGSELLPSHPIMEEDLHVTKPFPHDLGNIVNIEMVDDNVNAADVNNISLYFKKTVEGFQSQNAILMDNFEGFSAFIGEFIEALLGKLRATGDAVTIIFEHMESMKQKMKNMEMHNEEQEKTIAVLEKDCRVLLSACSNATSKLQFETKNNLLELNSIPELETLRHSMILEATEVDADNVEHQQSLEDNRYEKVAKNLFLVTRKVQTLIKLFESTSNVAAATIEDLQKKLSESRLAYDRAIKERDLIQSTVSELEIDAEALQNSCKELKLKAGDYQVIEKKLKEKEEELSKLRSDLLMKEQVAEEALMSASELKTLFDKIRGFEISFAELEVKDVELHGSVDVQKLFYIIDSVPELHNQINVLSHDKDKLQSTVSKQVIEIEYLKEKIETLISNNQESEKMKAEMSEITLGLEKFIDILGGSEIVADQKFAGDQKSAGLQRLLPVVEKQIMTLLWEAKNSKSQVRELDTRLLGSQKVIEELSTKLKLLEDSFQSKTVQPEIVQERSIFEAAPLPSGSEISEIEDVGAVGSNAISPVPSAAQLRTMRKGSTDHLVLSIDSESGSLINNEETDEEKGHAFKSLNTSGLIPKQGKSLADRIDGIWVSGGRVLMSRPRARLGLIAYWLFLHIWVLGTIL